MIITVTLPEYLEAKMAEHSNANEFICKAIEEKLQAEKNNRQHPSMRVLTHGQGFMISQAIFAFEKLRLDKLISAKPISIIDLAQKTSCHQLSLNRFLCALSSIGLIKQLENNFFAATEETPYVFMFKGAPLGKPSYQVWKHIIHTLTTGESAWLQEFDKDLHQYVNGSETELQAFNEFNSLTVSVWLDPLINIYNFSQYNTVVDIGGGEGNFLKAILNANGQLHGILFDQPQTVVDAQNTFVQANLSNRCKIEGGSFFESIPTGGDLYILSRILLNWDDENTNLILNNCNQSMNHGEKLLIIDFMIPDPSHPAYQTLTFNDLNLLVTFGGANRNEQQWRTLIEKSSFRVTQIISAPYPSLLSIIEVEPI